MSVLSPALQTYQRLGLQKGRRSSPMGTYGDVAKSCYFNNSFQYVPIDAQKRLLDPSAMVKYSINNPLVSQLLGQTKSHDEIDASLNTKLEELRDTKVSEWEALVEKCPYGKEYYNISGDGDGVSAPRSLAKYAELALETAANVAKSHRKKHPVTFLGLCGIAELSGWHTLEGGGYCLPDWEFCNTPSTRGALNWEAALDGVGLSFPVSPDHLFKKVLVNSRLCPRTTKGRCPGWTAPEADLKADFINYLHGCYVEFGLLPVFINIAGRSDKNKTQLVYDRLEKGHIALSMWHTHHMQYYGQVMDVQVIDQIAHVSEIFVEFCDLIKSTGILAKVKGILFHEKSFGEILLAKVLEFDRETRSIQAAIPSERRHEARLKHYRDLARLKKTRDALRWMKRYNEVVRFKKLNHHCNVPAKEPKGDAPPGWSKELGNWVHHQRKLKRNDNLDEDRVDLLEKIGFVFDPHEAKWMEMYQQLVEFKDLNKHCNVPVRKPKKGWGEKGAPPGWSKELGMWVANQRDRKNKLSDGRREKLENIGLLERRDDSSEEENE